jgi:hypothetical protein
MPNKRMQMPKVPELDNPNLTPFERFRILAKKVIAVPKDAIQAQDKSKPQKSG